MSRIAGKVALITGGGNGIGRAAALLFADHGARVVIAERDVEAGRRTARDVGGRGGIALFQETDVSQEDQVRAAVAAAVSAYGRLDVLYNNAGGSVAGDGPLTESDSDVLWRTLQLNLFSVWAFCKHGIPEIVRAGGGSVINTASVAGMMGLANLDAYTASKGAIIALTRSMAVEFAAQRVRVNAVAPTQTTTDRVMRLNAAWEAENSGSVAQTGRNLLGPADPDDVAQAALYLASDESRVTTGQVIPVDSGITIS